MSDTYNCHRRIISDDGICNPLRKASCAPRSTFKDRDDEGLIDRFEDRRISKQARADRRFLRDKDNSFSQPSDNRQGNLQEGRIYQPRKR